MEQTANRFVEKQNEIKLFYKMNIACTVFDSKNLKINSIKELRCYETTQVARIVLHNLIRVQFEALFS